MADDDDLDDSLPVDEGFFDDLPDPEKPIEPTLGRDGRSSHKGRKPKATRDEKAKLVRIAKALLAKGISDTDVMDALIKITGMGKRQSKNYLSDARAEMRAEMNKSDEEHRSDAYHFFKWVMAAKDAGIRDKMSAQDGIIRLLGLNKPIEVDIHHTHAVETKQAEAMRRAMLSDPEAVELMVKLTEKVNGLKMLSADEVEISDSNVEQP